MKIGVIGAGGWGVNLVGTLHEMGALGSVADIDEGRRATVEERYHVAVTNKAEDVLASDVPAVVIATPAVTHHGVARDALLAGKDVFVEKPLAISVEEGEDLVRLARDRDRILMVGHMLLFQPAIRWIHDYLADGSLGRLHALHQERLNLGRARAVENALWSLGVHDVAVLLHLAGGVPVRTTAWGQRVLQEDVEDDVHVHLEFANDVHAYQHSTWLWPEKRRRLVVIGSEGMLVYDELSQQVVRHSKGIDDELNSWDRGTQLAFRGDGEPLRLELEHFLGCVADRARPITDGESGVEVLRVLSDASAALAHSKGMVMAADG